ncbi:MAG: hypothetical protein ACRCY3_16095 [Sphingorhabdus sp.]
MKFRLLATIAFACAASFALQPVEASSDSTCYPEMKIRHTDLTGCSSTALLSPGNDTRVNLLMLLFDRHGAVGASNVPDYDSWYNERRRGEAQPFNYPWFAQKLGSAAFKAEPTAAGDDNVPWGTRCMSNDSGARSFIAALSKAKGVSPADHARLVAARNAIKPQCGESDNARATAEETAQSVTSKAGQSFAAYLVGAAAFYDGDYDAAQTAFTRALKSDDKWLAGAATYMLARNALNRATLSAFDNYGSLNRDNSNQSALAEAEKGFRGYLKAYTSDDYSASARGLLRRVYWLGQDRTRLTGEYLVAFAEKDAVRRNMSLIDLVQEMDVKLLAELKPRDVTDPELLAVLLLRDMRFYEGDGASAASVDLVRRQDIEALRDRFAGRGDLYTYLLATHALYVDGNPAEALRLLPANAGGSGYFAHSRQLLRAMALDAASQQGARAALIAALNAAKHPFQRGTAELALALHLERSKALDLVFADGSPIRDPDIREILLRYTAGPALLRAQATNAKAVKLERDVALYTLLYKQLLRGRYADFLKDMALIPADAKRIDASDYNTERYTEVAIFEWAGQRDFVCPALRTVATTLAANPKDARGLLCLGEFVRTNGMDPGYFSLPFSLDENPGKDTLGGSPSLFPGKRFSRLDAYKAIIANPAAGAENRAYALHRAIRCYAPAGYNGCDDSEQPVSVRKAWFQQLKREYPGSPWSTRLSVYW